MELIQGKIAERLIKEAIGLHASDIHIEPSQGQVRIRVRVDGLLEVLHQLPLANLGTIITQLKVLGGIDIAEKRVPQDGRFSIMYDGRSVDLRLSTLPTILGEKAAIRILDKECGFLGVSGLELSEENLAAFKRLYNAANGMVLVTGPTGSGKSTSLYGALAELNNSSRNIITLEDPVEYELSGVNQVALNRKAGLDFASGLRALVRQDPDVLMVGEIRDGETAAMAVQAALTGHLVLSTLHTNSAIGAIARLVDMGIERYLVVAALRGVVAQRLVRRICPHCVKEYFASAGELSFLGRSLNEQLVLRKGVGCAYCRGSGYDGRLPVQEVLQLDDALSSLILEQAGESQLLTAAQSAGFVNMYEDGVGKVLLGKTTVSELLRAGIYKGGGVL